MLWSAVKYATCYACYVSACRGTYRITPCQSSVFGNSRKKLQQLASSEDLPSIDLYMFYWVTAVLLACNNNCCTVYDNVIVMSIAWQSVHCTGMLYSVSSCSCKPIYWVLMTTKKIAAALHCNINNFITTIFNFMSSQVGLKGGSNFFFAHSARDLVPPPSKPWRRPWLGVALLYKYCDRYIIYFIFK